MVSADSEEAQIPKIQTAELIRNKKITALLVLTALLNFSLSILAWFCQQGSDDVKDFFGIHLGPFIMVVRAPSMWVFRVLGLIAGGLIMMALFQRPLSQRPIFRASAAILLLCLVVFFWVAVYDTKLFLDHYEANEDDEIPVLLRIFWLIIPSIASIIFVLAALAISLGFKFRALALFREKSALSLLPH